jgi:hypothetical protein
MAVSLRPWVGAFAAVFASAGAGLAQYAPPPPPPPAVRPPANLPPADLPPPAAHSQPPVADLTPPEFANHPPATHSCDGCRACDNPAEWLFSVEYLLVRPRRRPDDFAIVDPSNNLTPEGSVRSVGFDLSSGLRAAVGYRAAGSPWETWFTYTYLHADGDRTATAPPGGLVYPTLTRPGLVDTATTAVGKSSLTYNLYDLDAARRVAGDESFVLRMAFGSRAAMIDQDLRGFYNGGTANRTLASTRVEFDGGGPTAGGEARWLLPWGFQMFGRAKGGLIVGEVTNTTRELDNGGLTVNANVRERYYTTVPMLEMGTGVSWEYRNLRVAVGYEVANWFNLIDGPTFVNDFAEGKLGRRHGDLSLEGLFVQLGVAY